MKSFSDVIPKEWCRPPHGSIVLNFYSSSLAVHSTGRRLVDQARKFIPNIITHPVDWVFVTFEVENQVSSITTYSLYVDGKRQIAANLDKKPLPIGDYVLIMSPVRLNEDGGSMDGEAQSAIAAARGLLMTVAGHTSADQLIFTVTPKVDAVDHETVTSGAVEMFMAPEAFAFCDADTVGKLSAKIGTHLPVEHRRRFVTALSFIGRAAAEMDSTVRFSHLWIALEVSAGGFGKIGRALSAIPDANAASLKLDEIKEARRRLFHEGRRYALSQDQERLMCAVVMAQLYAWYGVQDLLLTTTLKELGQTCASGIEIGE